MLGFTAAEITGRTFWEFVHPDDAPGFWERVEDLLAGQTNHLRMEKPYYRKDGAAIWTDLVLSLVRDPQGEPAVRGGDDREHHRAVPPADRLQHQALHDPLTGLPNRTLFFERLDAALAPLHRRAGRRLLPGPRRLQGHQRHPRPRRRRRAAAGRGAAAGDRAGPRRSPGGPDGRRRVRGAGRPRTRTSTGCDGSRRPRWTRSADPINVGRPHDRGRVRQRRDRATAATAAPARPQLMKAADTTLYWAKADGRRPVRAVRRRTSPRRRQPGSRCPRGCPEALAGGEFVVEYQPLVRLRDQQTIGVEALVRWRLPDRSAARTRASSSRWPRRPA